MTSKRNVSIWTDKIMAFSETTYHWTVKVPLHIIKYQGLVSLISRNPTRWLSLFTLKVNLNVFCQRHFWFSSDGCEQSLRISSNTPSTSSRFSCEIFLELVKTLHCYGTFTLPDTETDWETDANKLTQNPIGICVGICVSVVWTPPHNSIQPFFYPSRVG